MKKIIYSLLLLLVISSAYIFVSEDYSTKNDAIYFNGDILTMDDANPTVEAVYVKDGKIIDLGTKVAIFKHKTSETQLIDLAGKTLLPGFFDIHTHPNLSAFFSEMVDLSGFTNKKPEQVWNTLETAVKNTENGKWIICKGLDPILTKGLVAPHISYLDSIAPNNPVFIISQSLHSYWANTAAFKELKIDKNTSDPSKSSYYEKDNKGNLTGFFCEQQASEPFKNKVMADWGKDFLIKAIQNTLAKYPQKGVTSIAALGISGLNKNTMMLYEHLSMENTKPFYKVLELIGKMPKRVPVVRHFVYIRHDNADLLPDSPQNGDDFFRVIGIKNWYDGSPYTGSMYLSAPYMKSPLTTEGFRIPDGFHGNALLKKQDLIDFIEKYQSKGWQVAVHSQGDQSSRELVEAFEEANKKQSCKPFRHRIEHCLLLQKEEIEKMKQLGISPSFHINHLYYYGDALRDEIIGNERVEQILPIKTALDNKMNITLHADQPMYESDPLSLLCTAVTRTTENGNIIGANQAISVMDGLKALTINSAWQLKMEDKLGSIAKNKYADFVVLDKNPLKVEAKEIRNIKTLETIRGGLVIYKKLF